jgi:hypothetical protein
VVFIADSSQPKFVNAGVSPIRENHSYFSGQADQRLGVCSVLSSYAVAACFNAGGLFRS